MRIASLLLALTSVTCLQAASAGTITEYNRATFQTALAGATLSGQNFDSLPLGPITTVDGVTYTPSLGTALVTNSFFTTTFPNGLGSTSVGFLGAGETLTISFATPITAFALDINTFATSPGAYTATLNDDTNSVVPSVFDVFPNSSTGQFFGFTDTASFTSVIIAANSTHALAYTVDSLVYGDSAGIPTTPTPEPSSLVLLGTGLLGVAGAVRRRLARL